MRHDLSYCITFRVQTNIFWWLLLKRNVSENLQLEQKTFYIENVIHANHSSYAKLMNNHKYF